MSGSVNPQAWLNALLGAVFSDGEEVDLQGGINFAGGLRADPNLTTGRIDVTVKPGGIDIDTPAETVAGKLAVWGDETGSALASGGLPSQRVTVGASGTYALTEAAWGGHDPAKVTLLLWAPSALVVTLPDPDVLGDALVVLEARGGSITIGEFSGLSYGLAGTFIPQGDAAIIVADGAHITSKWGMVSAPNTLQTVDFATSRNLTRDDAGRRLRSTAAATATIPPGVFRAGEMIFFYASTTDLFQLAPASYMTIRAPSGLKLSGQYRSACLYFEDHDLAILTGELEE